MSRVIADLLERCRAADVSLAVRGQALHVDFDQDRPPTDLIYEISATQTRGNRGAATLHPNHQLFW